MNRFRLSRFKEQAVQKRFALLLSAKMIGLGGLLGGMKLFTYLLDSPAGATPTQEVVHKANDFISPINTMWVLVAAFLVFFMQAGFMALEAGFARSRESVNIMME